MKNWNCGKIIYKSLIGLGFALSFDYALQAVELSTSTNADEIPINNSDYDKTTAGVDRERYILGSGDSVGIELINLPELSGIYSVGPDGFIYLPQLREHYVNGLTVKELRQELINRYNEFVIDPKLFIRIIQYRPVRVYVNGEVKRPGFYTLNGRTRLEDEAGFSSNPAFDYANINKIERRRNPNKMYTESTFNNSLNPKLFPTVFDAIRASQGITPYSNLSSVSVIRRNAKTNGGGKIKAKLNFLNLFTNGDQTQNIRVYDGDTITVSKSNKILKEQFAKARETNLSPELVEVYVSGHVISPGPVVIPHGSGLTQALAMSGGKRILSGNIEFLRFNDKGDLDRRLFAYNPKASINSYKNPILISGDIVNVKRSLLGYTSAVIGGVSKPFVQVYSLYNLFGFGDD